MAVSKASVPDIEEIVCCEYSNGLPSSRLNGSGILCATDMSRAGIVLNRHACKIASTSVSADETASKTWLSLEHCLIFG